MDCPDWGPCTEGGLELESELEDSIWHRRWQSYDFQVPQLILSRILLWKKRPTVLQSALPSCRMRSPWLHGAPPTLQTCNFCTQRKLRYVVLRAADLFREENKDWYRYSKHHGEPRRNKACVIRDAKDRTVQHRLNAVAAVPLSRSRAAGQGQLVLLSGLRER